MKTLKKTSIVTSKETTKEKSTNNTNVTITTDSTAAPLEFAHYCNKCKQVFIHKANLQKHKKEHSEATQTNIEAPPGPPQGPPRAPPQGPSQGPPPGPSTGTHTTHSTTQVD